ncbi:hypothetical protein RM780_07690 [Streptomyces sp. DSM 44917]|uniref:Uncharacterized protein n=1 Tax=Streptomyces boetiae TaxID=3075541 RepID=A0ABU2L5K0_9ACTN|nr:hypothetical protein [Streptomyces sp. DSM 44917]MDT0306844.1 hypothetical protein [Streptomyces sp. DSM 44917]
MTAPDRRTVTAWLHVVDAQRTRRGVEIQPASADYVCLRCGEITSASGDQVPAFVRTCRTDHARTCPCTPATVRATCPADQKENTTR